METFDIRSNIAEAQAYFSRFRSDQLPFATTLTLTRLAATGQDFVRAEMPTYLDRPNKYTIRSVRFRRATKRALRAGSSIYIDTKTRPYMATVVEGGTAQPKNRAFVNPVDQRHVNRNGKVIRNRAVNLLANPDNFSGTPRGRSGSNYAGIWQRRKVGRGRNRTETLRMLIHWGDPRPHRATLPFYRLCRTHVQANVGPVFRAAFLEALETARPLSQDLS